MAIVACQYRAPAGADLAAHTYATRLGTRLLAASDLNERHGSDVRNGFALTRAILVIAVLLILATSVACFVWAANSSGTESAIAVALASTLLSIGVAIFVTDVALKPIFTRDVLDLIGLRQRLHDLGLADITLENEVRWDDLYESSTSIGVVVTRPNNWRDNHLSRLVAAAKARPVAVDVFFPDPDSQATVHVAEYLDVEVSAYRSEVIQAAEDVESAWQAARSSHPQLHRKSTLTIQYLVVAPQQHMVRFNDAHVFVIPPITPERTGTHLALRFRLAAKSDASNWLEAGWQKTTGSVASAPKFSDRKPSNGLRDEGAQ